LATTSGLLERHSSINDIPPKSIFNYITTVEHM
jgi:hypothetical protein